MTAIAGRLRRLPARMGPTTRTVLLLFVLVGLGFVATSYLTMHSTAAGLIDEVDQHLIDDARASGVGLEKDNDLDVEAIGSAFGGRQALLVISPTGEVGDTAPSGPPDDPDPLPVVPPAAELESRLGQPFDGRATSGGLDYRLLSTRLPDGQLLVLATPMDATQGIIDDLRSSLAVSGGAVVTILGLFIWAVIRAANRQIDRAIDTATRIGDGDLTVRVDPEPGATEAARLARALNAMASRLETAFAERQATEERLRRFVADASHELRTPLATIKGYAQLHRSGALADPVEATRAIDRIESESTRMGVLVEELLLLARLDQGRPLDREEVDLRLIVTDSVADGRLHEPDRPLAVEIPDAEVWVDGDEARLRQVVANLLSNVWVHTPSDAAATVKLSVTGDRVELSVADTGPGLDPEAAAQVFDRFYRAEASRSRSNGGSGLGLAIAAAVAEAHGGELTLTTHPGEGATFTLSIPRTPSPAEPGDPSTIEDDGPPARALEAAPEAADR